MTTNHAKAKIAAKTKAVAAAKAAATKAPKLAEPASGHKDKVPGHGPDGWPLDMQNK